MRRRLLAVIGLVLLLCLLAALGTASGSPGTFTVNTTDDTDDGSCDPLATGDCTLREAIKAANSAAGSDTIEFKIPITDSGYMVSGITGTWTVSLTTSLPTLSGGGTVISGTTQAVNLPAQTNPDGPEIEISGGSMSGTYLLAIQSANNVIHGLVMNLCPGQGIWIGSAAATGNTISGNYIGTDAAGSSELGNSWDGISIVSGAQNNTIGPNNLISGNDNDGVDISGGGTSGNTISANYIGTDVAGSSDLGNGYYGVRIENGAQNNVIGPDNVISGNDGYGVDIDGSGTNGNTVFGNYIGTDATGTQDRGNKLYGVRIENGAQNNVIGPDNVISGNDYEGMVISDNGTDGNTVSGNYIGTDATGTQDRGNSREGVLIWGGAENNVIGGDSPGEGNVISGNDEDGVQISSSGSNGNTISGNYIGTDASGSSPLPNLGHGIEIYDGAQNNVIGGDTPGERNVIAFNGLDGIEISDATSTGNTITQNSIHNNTGLGIELRTGANGGILAPGNVIASCVKISGTGPANATVEIFTGPDGEGKTYLTTVSADGAGNWSASGPFTLDTYVTATATDADGNTSQFSTAISPGTCYQIFLPLNLKNY